MKHLLAIFLVLVVSAARAQQEQNNEVYTDNIVVVLDGSGSMREAMRTNGKVSRLDAAKRALSVMVDNFPERTNVGFLVFSGSYKASNHWLHPLGPLNRNGLKQSIQGINASEGTPLGQYMKIGADALLEQREKQFGYGSYRLIVVTDGEASDGGLMNKNAVDIVRRGIALDVTGVDMARDHTLSKLARVYRRADDPDSFTKAMVEAVAEIGSDSQQGINPDTLFAEISGIGADVASEMIKALNETGNQPIGEKPVKVSSAGSTALPGAVPNSKSTGAAFAPLIIIPVLLLFVFIVAIIISTMRGI